MNRLTLHPAVRPGEDLGGGARRTHREYADLAVDGVPLSLKMRRVQDLVSRLGWGTAAAHDETLAILMLEKEADFPDGRRAVYVCAECGDLDCGCVTIIIERVGNTVVWRDFQYQTEIDPPIEPDVLVGLGPFTFFWTEYCSVLTSLRAPREADARNERLSWWKRLYK